MKLERLPTLYFKCRETIEVAQVFNVCNLGQTRRFLRGTLSGDWKFRQDTGRIVLRRKWS